MPPGETGSQRSATVRRNGRPPDIRGQPDPQPDSPEEASCYGQHVGSATTSDLEEAKPQTAVTDAADPGPRLWRWGAGLPERCTCRIGAPARTALVLVGPEGRQDLEAPRGDSPPPRPLPPSRPRQPQRQLGQRQARRRVQALNPATSSGRCDAARLRALRRTSSTTRAPRRSSSARATRHRDRAPLDRPRRGAAARVCS